MRYVVAYDISNDRARRRVAELLAEWGVRLQQSVFEVDLHGDELRSVRTAVARHLGPGDIIQFFPQCSRCRRQRVAHPQQRVGLEEWCWIA